jgi:uncharacterized protein (TIRG00374 family)
LGSAFQWGISGLIGGASLFLLLRTVNIAESIRRLQELDRPVLAAAIAVSVFTLVIRAGRWNTLIGWGAVSYGRVFTALMAGQAINSLLPLRAGDVMRSVFLRGRVGGVFAFATIVIEKLIDTGVLAALFVFGIGWGVLEGRFPGRFWLATVVLAAGLAVAWKYVSLPASATRLRRFRYYSSVERQLRFVHEGLKALAHPRPILAVLVWSALFWGGTYVIVILLMRGAGLDVNPVAALAVIVAQYVGSPIPSPGRIGTHQLISVITLSAFAVPAEAAAAFGIALYLVVVLIPLSIGAMSLWLEIHALGQPRPRQPVPGERTPPVGVAESNSVSGR